MATRADNPMYFQLYEEKVTVIQLLPFYQKLPLVFFLPVFGIIIEITLKNLNKNYW